MGSFGGLLLFYFLGGRYNTHNTLCCRAGRIFLIRKFLIILLILLAVFALYIKTLVTGRVYSAIFHIPLSFSLPLLLSPLRCLFPELHLVCGQVSVINHTEPKQKGFPWLTLPCHSPLLREVRAGTVEKCCSLADFPQACQFAYTARTTCPGTAPFHNGLRPPTSIINHENVP